jgi:hypothetical protein
MPTLPFAVVSLGPSPPFLAIVVHSLPLSYFFFSCVAGIYVQYVEFLTTYMYNCGGGVGAMDPMRRKQNNCVGLS